MIIEKHRKSNDKNSIDTVWLSILVMQLNLLEY